MNNYGGVGHGRVFVRVWERHLINVTCHWVQDTGILSVDGSSSSYGYFNQQIVHLSMAGIAR